MRTWRVESATGFGHELNVYVRSDDNITIARAWDEEWAQFIADACNQAERLRVTDRELLEELISTSQRMHNQLAKTTFS